MQLGNGDYRVFARIHREITIAQADLLDPATAPAEIDRVLRTCYVDSQPVYIQLPTDMVEERVDAKLLETPIDVSYHPSNPGAEDLAMQIVLEKIYAAKRPVFLVDGAAQRRRVSVGEESSIAKLMKTTDSTRSPCPDQESQAPSVCGSNGQRRC